MKVKGVFTALVTPFTKDKRVDTDCLRKMVRQQITSGVNGLVVLGTTAETSTLTEKEQEEIVRLVINENDGRLTIIAGVCSNDTSKCVTISQKWGKMGADGLLITAPYYNKANERGMEQHFKSVADRVNVPIILYNVPSRTGCSIPAEVVGKLSRHPNIIGIKEASGDIDYIMRCARYINDNFALLSGNDDMVIPVLSAGGTGVVSVFSNLCPKEWSDMVKEYLEGSREKALEIQLKYYDLLKALFVEPNPIPIKTAMDIPYFRLPLCEMTVENEKLLRIKMKETGIC